MSSPNTLGSRTSTALTPKGRSTPRERWPEWREVLRRHRLQGIAGWLLEAGAPLALMSAQLLYIGGPWLGTGAHQLAHLLESDEETVEFLRYLDSGPQDVQEFPPGIA